ncbi:cupin domain protein [Lysobacter capsici]|uniref:cupin domain-containing protein n=1 Tax=Lysobacter capsici TaxID=435897 RepID=UPI00071651AF|nr:cupin domain-containing protein [Lysobacter capsici]ALN84812.1 cupin domain protein [Lysobacter capsici]
MNLQTFRQAIVIASALAPPAALAADRALPSRSDSYVERAADIAVEQPGPHEGDGTTTAYPFFEHASDFDIVFRQRALHPGASIGEHTNDKDEIYYIVSGQGELTLDGKRSKVVAGDAVLTRNGSRHGLRQTGAQDLSIIVVYRRKR